MPTNISNPNKNNGSSDRPVRAVHPSSGLDVLRRKQLMLFQKSSRIRFRSLELLNLSLVHRSASNEIPHSVNNERLEFLGDAVLGAVAATVLFNRFGDKPEGDLAKIKSIIVSEDILSGIALELQIDSLLILGKGEDLSGGRKKKAILADALEALIGAYYIDSGFKHAFDFVQAFMLREIERVLDDKHRKDYKTLLQELSQKSYRQYPTYELVKRTGPDHERLFWIQVSLADRIYGPGTGKNKKEAEQQAAKIAYDALGAAFPQSE